MLDRRWHIDRRIEQRTQHLAHPRQLIAYPGFSKDRLLSFSSRCGIAHIDGQRAPRPAVRRPSHPPRGRQLQN
jgi:hypothetical protein